MKGSCCNVATLPGRHKTSLCLLQTSTASLIFGPEVSQSNLVTWQKGNLLKQWTFFVVVGFVFFSGLASSIGSARHWMSISAEEEGIQQYSFRWIQFAIDSPQRDQASCINKGESAVRRYQASSPEKQNWKAILHTAPIDLWERS